MPGDTRLVARAKAGDADAFGQIYEAHVDRVYRYVSYRVTSQHEAEDLTEQVFLKAWEAMPRFEERGLPFAAWLYRLARNLVIDHYRGRRMDVSLSDVTEGDLPAAPAGLDPQSELAAKLEMHELRQAVGCLGEEQRQVVLLRFVEGLTHAEVAAAVGKSEGATRAIQHRALVALARVLGLSGGTDEAQVRQKPRRVPARARAGFVGRAMLGRPAGAPPGA